MTSFTRQPADLAAFWDERFEAQFMPWDQAGVPPDLCRFVAANTSPLTTLIPGCGAAYELAIFAENEWPATAIDFSASAVALAKKVSPLWAQHVEQADFFFYQPAQAIQLIYERAFFCALPPEKRPEIVARWLNLLGHSGLLAGFFFINDDLAASKRGPPFSITMGELSKLMEAHFELLEHRPASDSIEVFQGNEHWMVWRKRA
jgi:hypothetical protein